MTTIGLYLGITVAVIGVLGCCAIIWCAIRSNDDDHLTGPRCGGGTI